MTRIYSLLAVSAFGLLTVSAQTGPARPAREVPATALAGAGGATFPGPLTARSSASSLSNVVLTLTTLATLPGQTLSGLTAAGDGNFYGVMESGGSMSQGAVFQATPDGTLNILYSFTGGTDGAAPAAALVLGSDGALYGTASSGGNTSLDGAGAGTIFKITTSGVFTLVYSFTGGSDGDTPFAALVQGANGNFYGTTVFGGDDGYGVVFSFAPGGSAATLYSFDFTTTDAGLTFDNGASPAAALVLGTNGSFYGTTQSGGANSIGTVFDLAPGGALATLNSFTTANGGTGPQLPGPQLALGPDGNFYGTTYGGGASAHGSVFQLTPAGAVSTFYSFTGGADGGRPTGGLLVGNDGNFYGATRYGGAYNAQDPAGLGYGILFQLTPGGALTNLYSFTGGLDGANPSGALIQTAAGGFYGTTASTVFQLTVTTLPFIITQPAGISVATGATATLTVSAGGSAPLGYQWQFNGTNLPGANSSSLVFSGAGVAEAGYYNVVVSNAGGSTNSVVVLLAVKAPPAITVQPTDQTVGGGASASFTVAAVGTPPLAYQWRFNGTNLPGANAATLTLANVVISRVGNYSVVVADAYGSVTSSNAVLAVNNVPPTISKQPVNQIAGPGQSAVFSVTAAGTPPLSYQWELDGANLPGATGPALTLSSVDPSQAGTYNVVIGNSFGSLTSSNATLTVPLAPQFLTQPAGGNRTVVAPTNVTFTASAAGAAPLSYQWLFNGTALPGATNATYTLVNAASAQSGAYAVTASNAAGVATSSPPSLLLVEGAYTTTTLAGRAGSPSTNDGTGANARFSSPQGVAVDAAGNVYVADSGSSSIRKTTPNGAVTTLAGRPGSSGSSNGVGASARFSDPTALAVDAAGNVYVADAGNAIIRKITPAGLVSTIAGFAGAGGSTDGASNVARFSPLMFGIAVDSSNNVYVADTLNDTIRKITAAGTVTTFGGRAGSPGSVDGPSNLARFSSPMGLAVDSSNNIYVGDTGNQTIRKISPAGFVSTIAGRLSSPATADGLGTNARFNRPEGIAVDAGGNLYVADSGNNLIRMITSSGVVTTLAGGAATGPAGADGRGALARFSFPAGIAVDGSGSVYVADANDFTIRKAFPLASVAAPRFVVEPQSQTAAAQSTVTFAPVLAGSTPLSFQWQFNGRNLLTGTGASYGITNAGPAQAGTYTLVVTNLAGSVVSSNAILTVTSFVQETITDPAWRLDNFRFSIATQSGRSYTVEYKDDLTAPDWTLLQSFSGTGSTQIITEPGATNSIRFYRVLIQ